jgi:hypothetical protein
MSAFDAIALAARIALAEITPWPAAGTAIAAAGFTIIILATRRYS